MKTATRRLWLYGLLLLLPALAVGGLALGLLAREEARLAEREEAARETRRSAVEAQARLIVENIELLIGDVQATLLRTLIEAPAEEPRAFLAEWRASNPLVADVYRVTSAGRVVWGASDAGLRAWMAEASPWRTEREAAATETYGGFSLGATADAMSAPAPLPAPASASAPAEAEARARATSNVVQYQRARQEIQELARVKAEPAPAATPEPPRAAAPAPRADAFAKIEEPDAVARELRARRASPAVVAVPSSAPVVRAGWSPWRAEDGRAHLLAWRELPDGSFIGFKLGLDAIKARLGEVFPAVVSAGEGYALRDAAGDLWHASGEADAPLLVALPLADSLLPGWSVEGRDQGNLPGASPGAFFAPGAAIVALLVLAILAAGTLLLRQARRSEEEAALKTSFVANVSHELKTPLTTIRLYAELLAQGRVREEAKRADYLATIGQETERLARLVGNVLDFSRLEQGKKKFALAPVDLAAELRRLTETHAPRLAASGLALRVEAPETFALETDRDAVEQIVLNLLDNACKYAAGGGEVLLTLASDPASGTARVSVADRGPGVSEADCERIFEKFHRVDERLTAEKGGAGLGLSIARQLARGLGGELRCGPREGGGAVFTLTLPRS
jgi:signal transduction histidine kinase